MTDMAPLTPPYEPAEDALAFVGGLALDAIPIVGPLAGRALDFGLATRDRQRQHAFNVTVAQQLAKIASGLEPPLTVADILNSDEFVAAYHRASRAAQESASEAHRLRIAAAVASSGEWADFPHAERRLFARSAADLDDLQIWLLHYFREPYKWLSSHLREGWYENFGGAETVADLLGAALRAPEDVWLDSVKRGLSELVESGFIRPFDIKALLPRNQTAYAPQITGAGRRFLSFVDAPSLIPAPDL
ncbi:hypothetical protein [uncultured Microbacterium sp.]|uniref:hypothetical protein n=1 Tax=uncultured Microbacterium sp. TaxID=191216 RepID=UPI0025F04E85|nr:hypothetical protein [uncultured Microbacterium sp.]